MSSERNKAMLTITPEKNQAMVTNVTKNKSCTIYELISIDAFNKNPFTIHKVSNFILNDYDPVLGSIAGNINELWVEVLPYKDHNFDYATIIGINDDNLYVYGYKISHKIINKHAIKNKDYSQLIPEFHRGDKLLIETGETIQIVHNIDQAKLIYERDQFGQQIR